MLAAHLCRDQRLRACGFQLDAHLASGRRFWRVIGGLLPLEADQCDELVEMLLEHEFAHVGPGLWKWQDGACYTTLEAIGEVQREYEFLVRMQSAGIE